MKKEASELAKAWLENATITIFGLGLMGASLAMALRRAKLGKSIQAIDSNPDSIQTGLDLGIIDGGTTTWQDLLPQSDLIILALPVRAICTTLEHFGPGLKPGVIVTDLGSTKVEIVKRMEKLPNAISAVGGHPMCGRELNGIGAATADLYTGKNFFLTPTSHITAHSLSVLQTLIQAIGADPIVVDAEKHDRVTALTSHLPYLISAALLAGVDQGLSEVKSVTQYMGSGFLDMTRIAGSNPRMMLDILLTNRQNVMTGLACVEEMIIKIRQLLMSEQTDVLEKMLTVQMRKRRRYPVSGEPE